MKLASSFPVMDLGADPGALRAFAQGLEQIGYHEVLVSEHLLGVDRGGHPGWTPYNPSTGRRSAPLYDVGDPFLEPLVSFGFIAGVTTRLRMGSSVMVLGMRQAVLVAKQAAVADVLSGGRVTLGIGSGWNDVEYRAMGVDFAGRGARIEEQLAVMRALWTEDVVRFQGRWHSVEAAGLNPRPVQQPIPVWIGGSSDAATARAARVADAWYPGGPMLEPAGAGRPYRLSAAGGASLARFRRAAERHGRDASTIGLVGTVNIGGRLPDEAADEIWGWAELGAGEVNVRTARSAGAGVDDHLARLEAVARAWADRAGAV